MVPNPSTHHIRVYYKEPGDLWIVETYCGILDILTLVQSSQAPKPFDDLPKVPVKTLNKHTKDQLKLSSHSDWPRDFRGHKSKTRFFPESQKNIVTFIFSQNVHMNGLSFSCE